MKNKMDWKTILIVILGIILMLSVEYLIFAILTYGIFLCFGIESLWTMYIPIGFWFLKVMFGHSNQYAIIDKEKNNE